MLFFIILATFVPSIASIVLEFEAPYTTFPAGCHNFEGKLLCGSGTPILPGAKVILAEKDYITADDHLAEILLQNDGSFKIHKCATDFPTPNLELYLKFENVCQKDDKKQSGILKEDVVMEYVIYDNEKYAHTAINHNGH